MKPKEEYKEKATTAKKSTRSDKRMFLEEKVTHTQQASAYEDLNTVYRITQECGSTTNCGTPVLDKNSKLIISE